MHNCSICFTILGLLCALKYTFRSLICVRLGLTHILIADECTLLNNGSDLEPKLMPLLFQSAGECP